MTTSSLQALQDRFGRNVVFQMNVRLTDGGDKLGEVISATTTAGAHVGQVNLGKVLKASMCSSQARCKGLRMARKS